MRFTVCSALALTISLFAASAAADPPSVILVKEEAHQPPIVQTVKPVRPTAAKMIKGAEKLVMGTIRLTVWEGHEGKCAVLKFDPLFSVGGKLRITYEF